MAWIQFWLQTWYNAPMNKVNTRFPWFSDEDIKKLEDKTKDIIDPIEKAKIQNEIYRKVLPIVQQQKQLQARDEWLNELSYQAEQEKNQQKKSVINVWVKMWELGNAIKTKFNLPANAPDDEIIKQFIDQTRNWEQMLVDYINWKSEELLYVSGIKDRPMQQPWSLWEKIAWWEILPFADPLRPYEQWEWAWEYIWETLMNVPWSAWNIVAWLGNMLMTPWKTLKWLWKTFAWAWANAAIWGIGKITWETDEEVKAKMFWEDNPIYTFMRDKIGIDMKENEELADSMWWYLAERYWGIENIKKTFKEDPVWIIWDVVWLLEWWVWIAGKAWIISQAQKTSMLSKLAKVQPYTQVPLQTAKVWGKIVKWTAKWLSNMSEAVMNKLTAIDKEDRVFARKNPDLVNSYVNWTKTVDDVAQTIAQKMDDIQSDRKVLWQEYETIRASWQTADTSKIIETIQPKLIEKKITINKDWSLSFDKFSKFNKPQQNAINEAWKIVKDAGMEWKLDTDQILNLRQKIDDLVNWEWKPLKASWVDRETETLIKSFRKEIDNQAKTIQGLSDLDAKYWPVLEEANTLRKDWFNADWTLKDNALSKIKNLTNDANKQKLARLEKIMPWITDELRGLKVWLAVDTAMKSRVWQYAQQMLLWWWVVSVFTNPALILPLVWAGIVLTPKNIINTLQAIGKWQEWVSWVVNKIKGWNKLSTIEEARVWSLLKSKQDELSTLKDSLDLDTKPKNATSNISSNSNIDNTKIEWKTPVKQAPKLPKKAPLQEKIPENKVIVKAPEEPLIKEARKYKSAEEFVNNVFNKNIKEWDIVYYKDSMNNISKAKYEGKNGFWDLRLEYIWEWPTWKDWLNISPDKLYGKVDNIEIQKKLEDIKETNIQKRIDFEKNKWDYAEYKKTTDIKNQLKQIREQANSKWLKPKK